MDPDPPRGRSRWRWLRTAGVRATRVALLAIFAVAVISATVGTGVAPVDDTVDDAMSELIGLLDGLSGADSAEGGTAATPVDATTERARLELAIHERVNEARTERGLDPLAFDTDLREIARFHAEDMANRSYFSHTSPEGNTLEDRYERFGYDCRVPSGLLTYKSGGENLFKIQTSQALSHEELADRAVTGWLNSPAHRENLLDPDWRQEGIGVATASDGAVYATQNFC